MEPISLACSLGTVVQKSYAGGVRIYEVFSGSARKDLLKTLNGLLPLVEELCGTSSGAPSNISLQKFQQFHKKIIEGNRLIDECETSCICFRSWRVEKCVKTLEKDINEFIRIEQPFIAALQQIEARNLYFEGQTHQSAQLDTLIEGQTHQSAQLEVLTLAVKTLFQVQGQKGESLLQNATQISLQGSQSTLLENGIHGQIYESTQLENMGAEEETILKRVKQVQHIQISEHDESHRPDSISDLVGFDYHIMQLKKFVVHERLIVIAAMGGAGKSTLVKAFCRDNKIREHFKWGLIYKVGIESPPLTILKQMWVNIVGGSAPHFINVDDAHNKLQSEIKARKSERILVVLDGVLPEFPIEKLLFEGEQLTTLVTTRDENVIPKGPKTHVYNLPSLQEEDALSLFCRHAFGKTTIPDDRDKDLVMKVLQQCDGLPLALKVIGSSLRGKSDDHWKSTRDELAKGKAPHDNQINVLFKRLETCMNARNPREKQCFLDLAVFPKGRTIPVNVLLDIWVYVRGMERDDALLLLRKFEASHLLDFYPGAPESTDDSMDGYSVSQHDVMREFALFLAERDNEVHFTRLYMPQRQHQLPDEWQTDGDRLCSAQIVSIHTGAMKDTQWPRMDFPVAKALILHFSATEYYIPTFMDTMKRLKVLIIHNYDRAKRSHLSGVAGFEELSQLKALHLEKLIVPKECNVLKSLEKINMSLCEGLGRDTTFNFPELSEMNMDYCIDLEELPAGLCSSVSLKKLSVTHCHGLAKLPDEMDRLESLKEIRLCKSPSLKALSPSICRLKKLEYLDISSCMGLKVTKQGRSELKSTLEAVAELPSLKRVICDKRNEWLFKRSSRTNLKIQVVEEEEPNLDWLD